MIDLQMNMHQKISDFVKQTWKDLFKTKEIHANDGFFDLGGTSLAAIKFISAVEGKFGIDALSPEDLYTDQRFESIVATISKNVVR
ncbi:MAG: acyl carrier protein [Cohaesibacter sp.]|nr:acyl carrier protein [Cohaesibacter sp.]